MRLHHRVGVVGRTVLVIDAHRGGGKGAGKVAHLLVRRALVLAGGGFGGGQVVGAVLPGVCHAHELRGGAGLLEGLGHHHGHGLVVVLDFGSAQQVRGIEAAAAQFASRSGRDDGQHARRAPRRIEVDGRDAALGDARRDDVTIGGVGNGYVVLVRIRRRARGFQRTIDAIKRLADHLQLIDGIGGGRSGKFHASAFLCCGQHGAQGALHQLSLIHI